MFISKCKSQSYIADNNTLFDVKYQPLYETIVIIEITF